MSTIDTSVLLHRHTRVQRRYGYPHLAPSC